MIIGLTGHATVGKDEVADHLVRKYEFTKIAIAEPIKEMVIALNPLLFDGLRVQDAIRAHGYNEAKKLYPEFRNLLQRMGSEAGRTVFGNNVWIDLALSKGTGLDRVFSDV